MEIDRMIRRLLIEADEKTLGLGTDQRAILEKGMEVCPSFKKFVEGRLIKILPSSEIYKFPELVGLKEVAYIATDRDKSGVSRIFFGVQDPKNTESGKKQYLTYALQDNKTPQKFPQGWGSDCDGIQELNMLGKENLSSEQRRTLDDYLKRNQDSVAEFEPTGNMGEWKKLPYSEIINGYTGSGYVWQQKSLENNNINVLKSIEGVLDAQGFTRDETTLDPSSSELNSGILLRDLASDYPALSDAATKSPNTKVYLKANSLPVPDKETCRTIIKKLSKCKESKNSIPSPDCLDRLWINKVTALQCNDRNFLGGILGLKDEFEALKTDGTTRFGLSNLSAALVRGTKAPSTPQVDYSIKESIDRRVSRALNEEFKRIYRY